VIPREGVESYIIEPNLKSIVSVIPREGVESSDEEREQSADVAGDPERGS